MKFSIYIAILIAVLLGLFLILYGHIVDNIEIYMPGWVILFLSSVVTVILTQRMKSINKKPNTELDVKLVGASNCSLKLIFF
jgi:membrane-bound ClpP family serine protease